MPTSPNEDGRPTAGGAAQPVHIMNPGAISGGGGGGGGSTSVTVVELPDATPTSDGEANPNTTRVGSLGYGYNGSTWDRIRTAVSDALAATGLLAVGQMLWNGATWDRAKGDNTGAARVSLYGKGTVAGDVAIDASPLGALYVSTVSLVTGNDGASNSLGFFVTPLDAQVIAPMAMFAFNNATWDRQRNNHEVTALASAARTALVNSADLVNYNARGVVVTVDITAFTSGGLTCTIKYKDSLSGKYVTLLASAVLAAAATTMLVVFPGVTVAANLAASAPLPRVWRVEMTVNDATSITYSVSANYIN